MNSKLDLEATQQQLRDEIAKAMNGAPLDEQNVLREWGGDLRIAIGNISDSRNPSKFDAIAAKSNSDLFNSLKRKSVKELLIWYLEGKAQQLIADSEITAYVKDKSRPKARLISVTISDVYPSRDGQKISIYFEPKIESLSSLEFWGGVAAIQLSLNESPTSYTAQCDISGKFDKVGSQSDERPRDAACRLEISDQENVMKIERLRQSNTLNRATFNLLDFQPGDITYKVSNYSYKTVPNDDSIGYRVTYRNLEDHARGTSEEIRRLNHALGVLGGKLIQVEKVALQNDGRKNSSAPPIPKTSDNQVALADPSPKQSAPSAAAADFKGIGVAAVSTLEGAKNILKQAGKGKGGHRLAAIKLINKAIRELDSIVPSTGVEALASSQQVGSKSMKEAMTSLERLSNDLKPFESTGPEAIRKAKQLVDTAVAEIREGIRVGGDN
ncbi:MAG: hypothetical protein NTV11_10010 [Rhodocyclales bacterium]|nr:hypothetical protein [Rhodocyclales bacterium]